MAPNDQSSEVAKSKPGKGAQKKDELKGEVLEGKLVARTHDEVNLILVSGLLGLTIWCFVKHSPYQDGLQARAASAAALGYSAAHPVDLPPVFFWLPSVDVLDPQWQSPREYTWLTVAGLLYSVLDIAYLIAIPACTTKFATIMPHHFATIMLTTGALWLHVEPMTALCLLVELNTLFLTLKNLKRAPTVQQGSFSRVVHGCGMFLVRCLKPILDPLFIATWVALRLVFYPFLLAAFHLYFSHPRFAGWGYAYILSSMFALNVLNQWWTMGIVGLPSTAGIATAVAAAVYCLCF